MSEEATQAPGPVAAAPHRTAVWRDVVAVLVVLAVVVVASVAVRSGMTSWVASRAVSWLAYAVIALTVVAAVRRAPGVDLGFERARPGRQALVGVTLAAGLLVAVFTVLFALAALGVRFPVVGGWEGSDAELAAQVATAVLVVGPVEELAFRGYLLGRLREVMRPGWAVALQAVVFGLWHFPSNQDVLQVAVTAAIGLVLGVVRLRVRGGTVAALALGHGLYDATLTVLSWLAA